MQDDSAHKYTNRLIHETSPYLLQHAHNPVDWYPWGEEAFAKARKEDKLVLVSIGYAACHWCHVMERESFEDEQVARIMNEHFVCIKVDREERPDVDHTYMDAVQIMTGQGGWPLNCFTLPDGRPVYGGTYFRKDQWMSVLTQLREIYANDKVRVLNAAEELMKGIRKYNLVKVNENPRTLDKEILQKAVNGWKSRFDKKDGGNSGAPKFPMPNNLLFHLKYFYFSGDEELKAHLELSLDKMAAGGIYDHLGGGFARYSTDAIWMVPHFEKMLYDNAQLVSLYAKAFKLFPKVAYKAAVYETLEFVQRELTSPEGTFYSAIDADSEGKEGAFYVWKKGELEKLLGKDAPIFYAFYDITGEGNWEHGNNVLHQFKSSAEVAEVLKLPPEEVAESLQKSKQLLFEARSKRERPITDDKILTSWNAMMISGLVDAYRTFGEKSFLERALKAASYLKVNCVQQNGQVLRMARKKHHIPGFLDDYGLLAQACIDLYQATFDESWLQLAGQIAAYAIRHFKDESTGMFFYSDLDTGGTITNKTEISDNVIPASNSVMAQVLNQLHLFLDKEEYRTIAEQMLNNVIDLFRQQPVYFSNWGSLLCDLVYQSPEVVFTGKESKVLRQEFDKAYVYGLVAGSETESELPLLKNRLVEGKSLIYVCRNRVCKLPVENVQEAVDLSGG